MKRKIKYGKVVIVIFITVLIWFWADVLQDEELSIYSAAIGVAQYTNPNFWVSFENDEPSVSIKKIVLKGPASKIAEARRKRDDGSLSFEFLWDPPPEVATRPEYSLNVFDFLRKGIRMKRLGLMVESCEPETLNVKIVELVKRTLKVNCVDENENPVKSAVIDPSQVDMLVPPDWSLEKLVATVSLTEPEIGQARLNPVLKNPYIELAPGQTREATTTVKITTPPEEDLREEGFVTATLAIALSPALQGKYKVEITNLDTVMGAIAIRATPEAKQAFEMQPYPPMTLYILDGDEKKTDELKRKVVYNFPEKFVRNDEIELNQQPVVVRFKLIPLPPEAEKNP